MKNRLSGGLRSDLFPRVAEPLPEWDASLPSGIAVTIPEGDGIGVRPGDAVLCGQVLSEGKFSGMPTHSPVSGKVIKTALRTVCGVTRTALLLENDGEYVLSPSCVPFEEGDGDAEEARLSFLRAAGIPLFGKPLADEIEARRGKVRRLILHLLDDEPLGGAYSSLFAARSEQIVLGMKILLLLFRCRRCEIVAGDQSVRVLNAAEEAIAGDELFRVRPIPAKYPTGNPTVLPRATFGSGSAAESVVIPPQVALWVCERFSEGLPCVRRFVMIGGDAVPSPVIAQVPIGTPLVSLFDGLGLPDLEVDLFDGKGAMSARAVSPGSAVCGKETEGALAVTPSFGRRDAFAAEGDCVGCGKCASVCPRSLETGFLWKAARNGRNDLLQKGGLASCLLCGVCEYVCPVRLPITEVFAQKIEELKQSQPAPEKEQAEAPEGENVPEGEEEKEEKSDAEIQ